MHKKKTLLISIGILAIAALVVILIFSTEPTAQRESAAKETAMLVNTTEVARGDYQPVFVTTGTVIPAREITLSPRVSGEITKRSAHFNPGEIVTEESVLLQIDPADYRNNLELRKNELQQALANLSIEEGRQEVARLDYRQSEEALSEENEKLVLRVPQLKTARAQAQAARASVNQAQLDLERTTVKAPFHAQILSRNVDVGSQVAPGQDLARLIGVDEYWVEAMVPQSRIKWLSFPDEESAGAEVSVRNRSAWRDSESRMGTLYKMVGALNEKTRLVRVLISVEDPLGLENDSLSHLPLMVGAFVETGIRGREIEDVVKLSRDKCEKVRLCG